MSRVIFGAALCVLSCYIVGGAMLLISHVAMIGSGVMLSLAIQKEWRWSSPLVSYVAGYVCALCGLISALSIVVLKFLEMPGCAGWTLETASSVCAASCAVFMCNLPKEV